MQLQRLFNNVLDNLPVFRDAARTGTPRVWWSLAGPAFRGLILQEGKQGETTDVAVETRAHFDWAYAGGFPELRRLYDVARKSQWDADALDWTIDVDPHDPVRFLVRDEILPLADIPAYLALPRADQERQRHGLLSWMLSQFLHGEQGALFAACHVTAAVDTLDAKLFGSTQVVDEGRHVAVFHRYVATKLQKLYPINDNLFVILDALMSDGRWDLKFLGMQILIEGLALGAFATLRANTGEPLLRDLLRYVIDDEARHVHFGVLALEAFYRTIPEAARREREDWAFEMCVLLRNRFLAHEFYDEYYGDRMTRWEWDRLVLESRFMREFRATMFRRIVPNLKRIGLLSDRVRPHYAGLGLLEWEGGKAAPDLKREELEAGGMG